MTERKLALYAVSLYLVGVLVVLACSLWLTHGTFVYALDDPYIHLALAQSLAHGHYGINPAEFSSPSSSILWPFLLVPFAGTRVQLFLPLFWNVVFGCLSAALIGRLIARWHAEPTPGVARPKYLVGMVALLILASNLASLAMVGMEHSLQICLTIACAFGVTEAFSHRRVPAWCLAAAVLAPAVRYEDLSITLAVCIALWGARRQRAAIALFGASLLPLLAFGLFLHAHGLPALPESVLVKGGAVATNNPVLKLLTIVAANLRADMTQPVWRIPVVLATLMLAYLATQATDRQQRFVLAGATLVGVLQLTLGQFGWLHRYEDFAVEFLALLVVRGALHQRLPHFALPAFLTVAALAYLVGAGVTPLYSRAIYLQQYQMHRFVADFYTGNFAVNDLGLTSFDRRPNTYVLDLLGLASHEAAMHPDKEAGWVADVSQRKNAELAMLYAEAFHIPATWTAVGDLCEPHVRGATIGGSCVTFYSTSPAATSTIRADFRAFAATVPSGDTAHSF